jgi:hypothetical protein
MGAPPPPPLSPGSVSEPVKPGKAVGARRGAMHEPTRLSYRLTEEQKVQILQKKLRPRDVVRSAHAARHHLHKRMVARPPKPTDAPTGWDVRWSESQGAWYYWCPLTNVTCWEPSECNHDAAAAGRKGGLPLDSPYFQYAMKADARRHQIERGRPERLKERRRVQSAGSARRPQSSDGRSLSARAATGRPQSARVQSTIANAKVGPHPPSSTEAVIALRSANLTSAASARAAAPAEPPRHTERHTEAETKEAPWMLGRPADKYGRVPMPPREAQLWDRIRAQEAEAAEKENASARKVRTYGRGPGYRKHCMRIDTPDGVGELQDYESKDWRTRGNPGLPREYLHVRPKQQTAASSHDGVFDEQQANGAATYAPGDHVWLAGDPMATLKNGSGLFQKNEEDEHHLGPFSKQGRSAATRSDAEGLHTKPTGLVTVVQKRTGDCLVEWGVVGHCPLGMPRKLLWCTPSELKKVPVRKKMINSIGSVKSSMRMMRTMSTNSAAVSEAASDAPPESPKQRYNMFGDKVNANGTIGVDILSQAQISSATNSPE